MLVCMQIGARSTGLSQGSLTCLLFDEDPLLLIFGQISEWTMSTKAVLPPLIGDARYVTQRRVALFFCVAIVLIVFQASAAI